MGSDIAALTARFRTDLLATLGHQPDGPIALAVSGGPDSMAMLALARAAMPGQVIAATVDHRLRPESTDEAAMVARWCDAAGVPHAALVVEAASKANGNLHRWARRARYSLLIGWAIDAGAGCLCTAHHADDQAETFLMRAARGSGVAGLSGVRARRIDRNIAIIRPLLGWRRAELRSVAEVLKLPFVDDPSNADERFNRARFRSWLAAAPWFDPVQVARAARQAAEANDELDALGRWFWQQRASRPAEREILIDMTDLPRDIRRRLARMAVAAIESTEDDAISRDANTNIEPLLDALDAGGQASQGEVLATAKSNLWRFRPAPPRRSH